MSKTILLFATAKNQQRESGRLPKSMGGRGVRSVVRTHLQKRYSAKSEGGYPAVLAGRNKDVNGTKSSKRADEASCMKRFVPHPMSNEASEGKEAS